MRRILLVLILLSGLACGSSQSDEAAALTPARVVATPRPAPPPSRGGVTVERPGGAAGPAAPATGVVKPPPADDDRSDGADKPKRWLGITVANMDKPVQGAPPDNRAMVTRAIRGSPAAIAGMRRGDVIVEASGQPVKRYQDYIAQARDVEIGETLSLVLARDGKRIPANLVMMAKPADVNEWRKEHFPGNPGFAYDLPNLKPANTRSTSEAAKNKPQLLYFWATWCGPCRRTGPWIDKLHQEAGDKLQVVAISSEELKKLKPYVEHSSATYPIAHDQTGDLKLDYEVNKLPTVAVVDANNQIVLWDIGLSGVQRGIDKARELAGLTTKGTK